jgi:hypothetical protein
VAPPCVRTTEIAIRFSFEHKFSLEQYISASAQRSKIISFTIGNCAGSRLVRFGYLCKLCSFVFTPTEYIQSSDCRFMAHFLS